MIPKYSLGFRVESRSGNWVLDAGCLTRNSLCAVQHTLRLNWPGSMAESQGRKYLQINWQIYKLELGVRDALIVIHINRDVRTYIRTPRGIDLQQYLPYFVRPTWINIGYMHICCRPPLLDCTGWTDEGHRPQEVGRPSLAFRGPGSWYVVVGRNSRTITRKCE